MPDGVARLIFQEPPPPPEEPTETEEVTDDAETEEEVAEETTSRSTTTSSSSSNNDSNNDPSVSADARARIAEEAAARAEAMILGALGCVEAALEAVGLDHGTGGIQAAVHRLAQPG